MENKETKKDEEMKVCKHCRTDIPKKAKVCPNCKKKQGIGFGKILLVLLGVIIVVACLGGKGETGEKEASAVENSSEENKTSEEVGNTDISYMPVTADTLSEDLSANAAKASKTYKDQYVEVKGKLGTVDSDLAYISLSSNIEFDFTIINCYLQDESQEEVVLELSEGDEIVIKGKCTDVGEVFGYSIDIDEIIVK